MHTVHAQAANLFHPWHQHWAETICCQQLSLLAQTLAPSGGEGLESQTKEKKAEENERHFISSLISHSLSKCIQMFLSSVDLIPKSMTQIKEGSVRKKLWSPAN